MSERTAASPELQVFRKLNGSIKDSIAHGMSTIATNAVAKFLIEPEQKSAINGRPDGYSKADEFLGILDPLIKQNPEVLTTFTDEVLDDLYYGDLIAMIKREVRMMKEKTPQIKLGTKERSRNIEAIAQPNVQPDSGGGDEEENSGTLRGKKAPAEDIPGQQMQLSPTKRNIGAIIIVSNGSPQGYSKLDGPAKDRENLVKAFRDLGNFDIYEKENLSESDLENCIAALSSHMFMESYRCFIFIFTGHGKEDCVITHDGKEFPIYEKIIEPLLPDKAENIKTIPKIFLFDSCRGKEKTLTRGGQMHESRLLKKLAEHEEVTKEGNILVAYSTLDGTYSFDREDGRGGTWLSKVSKLIKKGEWYMDSIELFLTEVSSRMQEEMRKVPKKKDLRFLQPVRVSLLNQHVCLNPTPSGTGRRTTSKMNADELGKWLKDEGIDEDDIRKFKEKGINERLFLRLKPGDDITQATKDQIEELQNDLKGKK